MELEQEDCGVLLAIKQPCPDKDLIFKLLFDSEIVASVALAQLTGFSPIPCYEFRWYYDHELPVPVGTPQHRALLKNFGCMWRWEKIEDAEDGEPWHKGR
ncbi:hypothetical protein [Aulosira sp. FACHB-615]|uniref:hypothetical protein n=1 Tax=Aulosira sp. FACHB-615 TaxID=2692777 RepID=UPI0016838E0D|nr:hypothetical protein [Aulosira sp. FACHB-615]MBD2492487.1 hypothetical protein [Aulosira sp. FACHB-615]